MKGRIMRNPVKIENIEELRRRQGIDDDELRKEIRGLAIGDVVKLTHLTGAEELTGETLLVRITSIRGSKFRGKLASQPVAAGPSELVVGSPVAFTTAHIHSLAKGQSRPAPRVMARRSILSAPEAKDLP
jgi:hypothetical protein